jgi:hypothetical protein
MLHQQVGRSGSDGGHMSKDLVPQRRPADGPREPRDRLPPMMAATDSIRRCD